MSALRKPNPLTLDFFRAELADAWSRVDAVPGPELGDAAAPLSERARAFAARLAAFKSVWP